MLNAQPKREEKSKRGKSYDVIHVHAGMERKGRVRRAVRALKRERGALRSETDLVIKAVDELLNRLAKRFPEIDEAV